MRPRIVLVVLITAALLATAGWAGVLTPLLSADRVHSLPFVAGMVALGLANAWMSRWDAVKKFVTLIPFCSLALTGYGIILTYPEALAGVNYNTRIAHTVMALAPNCMAGAAAAWLFVLRWICKP